MRVEELIIDGFKSYASRTHIKGWDPEFNAITGLNGSGKSNVLDALCFVLGIKNYKLLRSNNIMDLIYKKGQAGITKASVTVVFNNTDKKTSPPGYEAYMQITLTRQIMIGGKSKYMINGHNALEQTVYNMLQTVQLNINNPHFLIMQGKITQVLNMQPKEILSMIEEAAGTRMFEDRKDKAIKTIIKKDRKIEEIQVILKEEIAPKLDKLREEKQGYLEYQKLCTESDRLERLVTAFEYTKAEEQLNSAQTSLESYFRKLEDEKQVLNETQSEIANIIQIKEEIASKRKMDNTKDSAIRVKQEKLGDISKEMVKVKAKLDISESSIVEEETSKKEVFVQIEKAEKNLIVLDGNRIKHQSEYNNKKNQLTSNNSQLKQMDQFVQSLTTGVTTNEENSGGFDQQLQDARNSQLEARTRIEQYELKSKMLLKEKSELQPKTSASKKEINQLLAKKEDLEKKISFIGDNLQRINFNKEEEEHLSNLAETQLRSIETLTREEKHLSGTLSGLELRYSNPEPGFDRSRVKGVVAQLVRLGEQELYASQALEVCAGGRLYNVVVDTDQTGAKLLEKGQLRKRVTIIPLNKISGGKASFNSVKAAQELAPGKVDLALTFVGYDKEVARAMEYVFGNSLICQDSNTAKLVTFNKQVRLKSITLDGDVYDPSGTLQGGSKPSNSGILEKFAKLSNIKANLQTARAKYNELLQQIESKSNLKKQFMQYSSQLDLDKHALSLVSSQIDSSIFSKMEKRLAEIDQEIINYKTQIAEAEREEKESRQRVEQIQLDMKDFARDKDGKLGEIKSNLDSLQQVINKLQLEVKKLYKLAQSSELEYEEQKSELKQLKDQIQGNNETSEQLKQRKIEQEKLLVSLKKEYNQLSQELGNAQMQLQEYNAEIKELENLHKSKTHLLTSTNLNIQKMEREVTRVKIEQQNLSKFIKNTTETPNNSWIPEMKHLFGQPNNVFDFLKQDPVVAKKNLAVLKERLEQLVKTTNLTVQSNIESVEIRENSLKQMMRTVLRDKRKIQETINSLDEYKLEALDRTWKIVNTDFGNIFSDLLPGNTAKLEPLENLPITSGLQVRVNLGGVWKNSLNELSGGQRSLVALSLILALLQFKPAPMYILDEIDAALDLSHTQNIGKLFKSRFKGSQFIVVSLKEGMFNNANVLFRARFRNGVSTIERA